MTCSVVYDSASYGVVRSLLKTPTSLAKLTPIADDTTFESYENWVNDKVNARVVSDSVYELFH